MKSLSSTVLRRLALSAALGMTAFVATGCGGGDEGAKGTSSPGKGVADTVVIDGSSTVYPISEAAREAYEKVESKANVIVDKHGTGGGFGRYLKGEVDIVDASRAAKSDEAEKAKSQGIDWTQFLVGYDGIAVVVNKKNDFVKSLSVADLKRLFAADGGVKSWKDLNPAWPDRKIIVYTPDKDSGTFEFFVEAILGKGGKQRDDVQASADDNTLVKGVSGDIDGIGYFGYAYYATNTETLRAIGVKATAEATAVEPNLETILKKSYAPLSRPLYIYVKKSSMAKPATAAFVKFYLENINTLVKSAGYVPPTDEDQVKNKADMPSGAASK